MEIAFIAVFPRKARHWHDIQDIQLLWIFQEAWRAAFSEQIINSGVRVYLDFILHVPVFRPTRLTVCGIFVLHRNDLLLLQDIFRRDDQVHCDSDEHPVLPVCVRHLEPDTRWLNDTGVHWNPFWAHCILSVLHPSCFDQKTNFQNTQFLGSHFRW